MRPNSVLATQIFNSTDTIYLIPIMATQNLIKQNRCI